MNNKFFLIFVFITSFLVRALFFIVFVQKDKNCWVCTDSAEYHSIAVNVAQGEGIKKGDGELNFRRLPGYPIFLATVYKFFENNVNKALWLQILISSLVPVLMFYLLLVFFPSSFLLAKIVSLFSVFNLGFILYSGMLLSDSLFLLIFLLFCLYFFSSFKNFSYKRIFFAGILLGALSLVRPVGHYLLLITTILVLLLSFDFIKKVKASFLFFLGWFLIVFWWLLRNWIFTGYLFFHKIKR